MAKSKKMITRRDKMATKNYICITIKLTMKNKILFALLTGLICFHTTKAQVLPNYSFENWGLDTNYLDLTQVNPNLLDTSYNYDPNNWTTSNGISNSTTFHHRVLVTQSSSSYIGSSSIQLRSDSISALITGVPVAGTVRLNFVCPGFAVCGRFNVNLSAFVNLGGTFNPALLPGAGIPVPGRVSSIGGYLKYTSVGGDSAYVVAVLRKGSTLVAQAKYTRYITDTAFTYFEVPFVYENCLEPDTLVYTLSSGDPYTIGTGVLLGNPSGLHIGSTLLADSVFVGDTLPGFGIAEPLNDTAHTTINTAVTIPVTVNDTFCSPGTFILSSVASGGPSNGTITISGDSITYTPNTGFIGLDTFLYGESIGGGPVVTASVIVRVSGYPLGISTVASDRVTIYPNPASSRLYVSSTDPSVSELRIYDMLGKSIRSVAFSTSTSVDLSGFSNGLYIIQFTGNEGKMISTSRFTVVK
jgi:hypothetical protein